MKTDKTPMYIKLDEKMEVSDGGRLELENPLSKGPGGTIGIFSEITGFCGNQIRVIRVIRCHS